jgi:exodeoxyribonuclease-3
MPGREPGIAVLTVCRTVRPVKVITWNVNSLRARLERTKALLARHQPDVLCLQETKIPDDDFPFDEFEALGYHAACLGQRAYNGVAILSRLPLEGVSCGFPGDPVPEQSRAVSADIGGLRILDVYVINGKAVEHPDYQLKLRWLDALDAWLCETMERTTPLLLVGDFNIAPEDIDVHDPELWRGKSHCTDAERERVRGLMGGGLTDVFRRLYPNDQRFTWWDYRAGNFHKNLGLRIDLALASQTVLPRCVAVDIDREERKPSTGEGKPSDHAPVIVTLDP